MKYLIANWKMNPAESTEAELICRNVYNKNSCLAGNSALRVVLCPPHLYLASLVKTYPKLTFGAQDCFWANSGAYTGEVSPQMLKNLGVGWVIIGHSERRRYLKESNTLINKKIKGALLSGLRVVLAVGEKERSNDQKNVLARQLQLSCKGLKKQHLTQLLIAYEPVWAIGAGQAASPNRAVVAAIIIRQYLALLFGKEARNVPILYGGSTNINNIEEFSKRKELQGVLVGGASIKNTGREFADMIELVSKI